MLLNEYMGESIGVREEEKVSKSVLKYNLRKLKPVHREIARRLLCGERPKSISKALGISASNLSIIIHSPVFQKHLKRLEERRDASVVDVSRMLRDISPVALDIIERLMYLSKNERLKFDAAESILDRAGFGKMLRSDVNFKGNMNYSNLTREEIIQLVIDRLERMKADTVTDEAIEQIEGPSIESISYDANNTR